MHLPEFNMHLHGFFSFHLHDKLMGQAPSSDRIDENNKSPKAKGLPTSAGTKCQSSDVDQGVWL